MMTVNDVGRNGESKADFCDRICCSTRRSEERGEQSLLIVSRDTDSVISDPDDQRLVGHGGHLDVAELWAEIDSVGQQVDEDALQLFRITHDLRQVVDVEPNRDIAVGRENRDRLACRAQNHCTVALLRLDTEVSRLDIRQRQDVFDERELALSVRFDHREHFALFGRLNISERF